jgi:hypothetical protein
MSARTRPLRPTVTAFWRSSILPSTLPSTTRSSSPLRSPLMRIDGPMVALPRLGSAPELRGGVAAAGCCGCWGV